MNPADISALFNAQPARSPIERAMDTNPREFTGMPPSALAMVTDPALLAVLPLLQRTVAALMAGIDGALLRATTTCDERVETWRIGPRFFAVRYRAEGISTSQLPAPSGAARGERR